MRLSASKGKGLCWIVFLLSLFPWCLTHGEMGQIQGFGAFQNLENRIEGSRQWGHGREAETENRTGMGVHEGMMGQQMDW